MLWCVVIASSLVAASTAVAQGLPVGSVPPPETRHRVLVLPSEIPVYLDLDAPAHPVEPDVVSRAVHDHLERHPYFELLSIDAAREILRSDQDVVEALQAAKQRLGYGQQQFFGFNFDAAIEELEMARGAFDRGFATVLARDRLADTLQYLAFSLLDRNAGTNDLLAARRAMQQMVRIAPYIVIDPQRQPAERVRMYLEARESVFSERALRSPAVDELDAIATLLDLDYIIDARLVQIGESRYRLEVDVYDHNLGTMLDTDDVVVPADSARAAELADARLGRFTYCVLPKPVPEVLKPTEAGRIYIDFGFAYFVFLESPTSSAFDNLGAAFTLTWMLTDYFSTAARFSLAFSGEDRAQDLQTTFNTFRASLLVGLSAPFEWVRPFLYAGIELAKPTSFETTTNPKCKVEAWRNDATGDCSPGDISTHEVDLLVGLQASAGATINVGIAPIFLTAAANFAFYVIPVEGGKAVNFPIGFDLGLEYRF